MRPLRTALRLSAAGIAALLATANTALAAEGASSHYLPGTAGDIAIAVPPQPGLLAANTVWIQVGNVDTAVLQGRVDVGLDLTAVLDLAVATYTFDTPFLDGVYTIGAVIPFGYAELTAEGTGPRGRTTRVSEDSFNLSDMVFVPLQLNWQLDEFSFKFAHSVIAPTGGYSLANRVNLGRNYWSFDTLAAVTWLHAATGTEASVAPGIMLNTKNDKTDYLTGTEFHLDFTVNQFLAETFAIGIRGYYYKQLTGDSGSGAVLGSFKGESVGIGPGFVWIPGFAGGRLTILGKWLHDLSAERRFDSDYATLTAAWKF